MKDVLLKRDILLDVVYTLLKELKVKVPKSRFSKEMKSHPDYPSLLSISDTLKYFGVDNLPVQASPISLEQDMLPCLVLIQYNEDNVLSIVKSIDSGNVSYLNPKTLKYSSKSLESFAHISSNNLLLVEPSISTTNMDDQEGEASGIQRLLLSTASLYIFPVLTVLLSVYLSLKIGFESWPYIIYNGLLLVGALATGLLILSSLQSESRLLKIFCGESNTSSSCSAVSNARGSKLFGHNLMLLGSTFFLGSLLFLILQASYAPFSYHLLFFLNLLATPIVLYSFYQQAFVLKKWCTLCITVQSVLVLQIMIGISCGWLQRIAFQESQVLLSSTLIVCMLIAYLSLNLLIPYIGDAIKEQQKLLRFERLKKDPALFNDLLSVQQPIVNEDKLLGFKFGPADAEIHIVKVCNPYCDPCARAHSVLDDIVERNDNVSLQVIFSRATNDQHADTIRHFISLSRQQDQVDLKAATRDWYLDNQKNLETFKHRYPADGEEAFDGELDKMHKWCIENDIRYTPTIYINGRRIPSFYTVEDLKYFLL